MYCLIDSRDSTATARMPFFPASAALMPLLMFGALLTLPAAEKNSNRDKTGTSGWSASKAEPQSEKGHRLTTDGSFEAERAGLLPLFFNLLYRAPQAFAYCCTTTWEEKSYIAHHEDHSSWASERHYRDRCTSCAPLVHQANDFLEFVFDPLTLPPEVPSRVTFFLILAD